MGIAKGAYRLLLEEKKRGNLHGETVLQLGRQCILFNHASLIKYARMHGVQLSEVQPALSFDSHYRQLGFIDDFTLFRALGFKTVESLDYSDFEGAGIVWDLNQTVPESLWGKYDVIYDGGTAEHVFHFPQVLHNIHLMLKEGGVIIHLSPSHNHVDHGFYMYSPQIYTEYYAANQYDILTSHLIEYKPNHKRDWTIYAYHPGALGPLDYGGFGKQMLAIHLVAQKTPSSTSRAIPQQGGYLRAWNAKMTSAAIKKKVDPITRLGISLKKKFKRYTPLRIQNYFRRKKLKKIAQL